MFKRNVQVATVATLVVASGALSISAPAAAASPDASAAVLFVSDLQADAGAGDPVAVQALADYRALSAPEQARFDAAIEALAEVDPGDAESVPGVTVTEESEVVEIPDPSAAAIDLASANVIDVMRAALLAATTKNATPQAVAASTSTSRSWSAYCAQSFKVLGITVSQTRVDGDFDTKANAVTGIRNARARVVKNYQPLTHFTIREVRTEKVNGNGSIHALIRADRGPIKGLGSQREEYQTLTVKGSGKVAACKWGW